MSSVFFPLYVYNMMTTSSNVWVWSIKLNSSGGMGEVSPEINKLVKVKIFDDNSLKLVIVAITE